jgi:hypothetical protein
MNEVAWQGLFARLEAELEPSGLDLVHAFDVEAYNQAAPETEQLDDFGRSQTLGVLIGNTRRLWAPFVQAYALDSSLSSSRNPLDDYVVARIEAALACMPARSSLVFAHVTKPRAFPFQRLADRVGLAGLSPVHLAIHPQHGPWFALRAVATFDVGGCPSPAELERPCKACAAPCVPALQRALHASGEPLDSTAVARHAREWIGVRDACPVGRASRYGAAQLAFHYAAKGQGIVRADPVPQ